MKIKENHKVTIDDETTIEVIEEPIVKFDPDSGKVTFSLFSGDRIVLSSPKGKVFLLLQSWYSSARPDERSDAIAMIKMAYFCISKFERNGEVIETPLFTDWFDEIEMSDIEVIGKAVNFFRDIIERSIPNDTIQLPR